MFTVLCTAYATPLIIVAQTACQYFSLQQVIIRTEFIHRKNRVVLRVFTPKNKTLKKIARNNKPNISGTYSFNTLQPKMLYAIVNLSADYTSRAIAKFCCCTVQMIVKDYRRKQLSLPHEWVISRSVLYIFYAMCNNYYIVVFPSAHVDESTCEPMLSWE